MIGLDFIATWVSATLIVAFLSVTPFILERYALTFLFALALKTLTLYGLVITGNALSSVNQALASLGALLLLGVFYQMKTWAGSFSELKSRTLRWGAERWILVPVVGALFLASVVIAWRFPVTETDAIWYVIRGMRIYFESTFDLGDFNFEYSPFVPLLFSWLASLGVDHPKILFPFFYLCLLIVFYFRVCEHSRNPKLAALFTLLLATTPYVWWHSVLPLFNLSAGLFFSLGAFYWYGLMCGLSEGPQKSIHTRGAVLSGCFFGLAIWTRLEFILYVLFPVFALWMQLDRLPDESAGNRNKIGLLFPVSILIFPLMWMGTVLQFNSPVNPQFYGLVGVAGFLFLATLVRAVGGVTLPANRTFYIRAGGLAVLVFLVLLAVKGPKSVSWGQALVLGAYRTIVFNVFFAFTLALVGLLLVTDFKRWRPGLKWLGGFLLAYWAMHGAIYTYMPPKWTTLWAYVDVTFLHPGNSVNSSGVREMLAFYPTFVFFFSCLPELKALGERE